MNSQPLGIYLDGSRLFHIKKHKRYEEGHRYLDRILNDHPDPTKDPRYIECLEQLAFFYVEDKKFQHADTILDLLRAHNGGTLTAPAQKLDEQTREGLSEIQGNFYLRAQGPSDLSPKPTVIVKKRRVFVKPGSEDPKGPPDPSN